MAPDAKLRMDVYQEGQRAYSSGEMNPYPSTDWRFTTWNKGHTAAEEWHADVPAEYRKPPPPADTARRNRLYDLIRSFGYTTSGQTYEIVDALLRENGL